VPNALEDDPVRAVEAALELHADVRREAEAAASLGGEPLAVHTGISSGLIMVEYRNDREGLFRLTGDTVNTAARLRSLAAADEILIGPNTERLVRPYFELVPLPAVYIKGKALPIVPARVLGPSGVRSRFDATRRRGLRGFVGRAAELATLRRCLVDALAGTLRLVTLEGDPGIGKSRLVHEFLRGVDREQFTVPQGHCQAFGAESPYHPFLDGLRRGLHIQQSDPHPVAAERARDTIARIHPTLERFLPIYLHLLAIATDAPLPEHLAGENLRDAAEEALGELLARTSEQQPTVVVLENWHWSDPASRSLLRALVRRLQGHRLMFVVTHRSGFDPELAGLAGVTSLRLEPLDPTECEELIRTVAGATHLPPGLAAALYGSTDGNPLFVEEACQTLIDSGALEVKDDELQLRRPVDELLLPDSVQAVIRARLDRLDEEAKEVVAVASVIGRAFDGPILARIYRGRADLAKALDTLCVQDIIRRIRAGPEPGFVFKHALTREVAYTTLLIQQRREIHEAVGDAIQELYPERLLELASLLAHHYRNSARAAEAVRFALLAGDHAARIFATTEATGWYDMALAVARGAITEPQAAHWEADAVVRRAAVAAEGGDSEQELRELRRASETAGLVGDDHLQARALYWLGRKYYVRARHEQAIDHAQRSLEIADRLGDAALAALPVGLMGRVYWQVSDFARSAVMTERSIEQMQRTGNRREEATAAGFLSALLAYMGEFTSALGHSDRAIELAREVGDPAAEAASLHYRGIIHDQQGQWAEAIADYTGARRIAEQAEDRVRIYIVDFMRGRAETAVGNLATAEQLLTGSLALADKLGTTFLLGQATTCRAQHLLVSGAADQAIALCQRALELARAAGDRFTEALALRTAAEARWRPGRIDDIAVAQGDLLDAVAILERIGARPELARSHAVLGRLLERDGDRGQAAAQLEQACRMFRELRMRSDLEQAQPALTRLRSRRG
jgi:tetratricopeptide (TPR) repeat protein